MEWATILELALGVLVLLVVAPLLWLYARRRWLSRRGEMINCGLQLNPDMPGSGWELGAARFDGEHLEWYRALSLSLRPKVRLRRTATVALENRAPNPEEGILLYSGERIVRLETTEDFGETQTWKLAMNNDAVTGLLAWLEAAPPSVGRFIE